MSRLRVSRAWLLDSAERVGVGFGLAFVSSLLAAGVLSSTTATAAVTAGAFAGLAVLKVVLASLVRGTISPASLAPEPKPEPPAQPPAPELLHYSVPLRADLAVSLDLPAGLTAQDADRLSDILAALVLDRPARQPAGAAAAARRR